MIHYEPRLKTNNFAESTYQIDADNVNIPKVNADDATLGNVIGIIYVVIAAVAVFYIVWSGTRMVLFADNADHVKKARTELIYAAIGLVASSAVFGILRLVVNTIG